MSKRIPVYIIYVLFRKAFVFYGSKRRSVYRMLVNDVAKRIQQHSSQLCKMFVN